MAPGDMESGPGIQQIELRFDAQSGVYHYDVVVKQIARGNPLFKGRLKLVAVVPDAEAVDGSSREVSLNTFPQFSGELPAQLRYRFFQNIEGEFKLPEGVVPASIIAIIVPAAKADAPVSREFSWQEIAGEL
jgi:hypothetical protein